jgi:regulator of sigma E protease
MSAFLISVVSVLVILGFMVLIHEFGHYAVAKLLGVRVEVFSIGFGKRLFGFRRGETDYRIAAIPLGGYVKMSGENPMDHRTDDPAEFMNHPRWHRFLIAIAGPAMNIALAIGLLAFVYMVHYEYPIFLDQPAVISWVKKDSAAAHAKLQPGDKIISIDGIANPTWEQVEPRVMLNPNQPVPVSIQRGNEIFSTTVTPKPITVSQVGSAGWFPNELVVIGELEADKPAAQAGLKEDDKILAMNGKPVPSIDAMIDSLQETKDQPVVLTVLRDGQSLTFNVKPVLASTEEPGEQRYRIGFLPAHEMKVGRLSLSQALSRSLDENKKTTLLIMELVQKLVQRKVSLRTIEGPIGIGRAAGAAASEKGWTPLLGLTAAISLNLGIFNLLPIPILDGGVILLLFLEGLMRRDISLQIKERIYQAAFVFLVLFAAMVIYNDLVKTIPGVVHRMQ